MPTLYVVATPIGNLEDITIRALRVLGEVDLIAAEDTRVTRRLLDRYQIETPVTSYHEHNKRSKLKRLLEALVEKDVALVSDAGMPSISDPGSELVAAAAEAGFAVVTLPGASALTTALAVSGIAADEFIYVGFLPRNMSSRRELIRTLADEGRAIVAFETPQRLLGTLRHLRDVLGDRPMAVCRELTKLHEEVFRGTAEGALAHFERPRGEFTLVIEAAPEPEERRGEREELARRMISELRNDGARSRDVVARVSAESGLGRRQVYRLWLEAKDGGPDPTSERAYLTGLINHCVERYS